MPHDTRIQHSDWRKASLSFSNGACAEVSAWRKSTVSSNTGQCVEAGNGDAVVDVRDTAEATHPYRITLEFSSQAWRKFLADVRNDSITV